MSTMQAEIIALVNLTTDEVKELNDAGCTTADDLAVLEHVDLQKILKKSTVVKIRSLAKVAWYLAAGRSITDATTMNDIIQYQHQKGYGSQSSASQASNSTASSNADVFRYAPKLHINALSEFSGEPHEFETWEMESKATIGQTVYSKNSVFKAMVARDVELFNMFIKSMLRGLSLHVMNQIYPSSGYKAWEAVQKLYGSDDTSTTIIDHYRNKLQSLRLDDETTASEYVNEFIICCQKLEARNEGMTEATKRTELLNSIVNDDYDVMKQQLIGDSSKDFRDCVTRIRAREQEILSAETKEGLVKKVRRNRSSSGPGGNSDHDTRSSSIIPEFPKKILTATHRHFNTVLKNDLKR